jgi:hypothetical protein
MASLIVYDARAAYYKDAAIYRTIIPLTRLYEVVFRLTSNLTVKVLACAYPPTTPGAT